MVSLNLPVDGTTADYGVAPAGQDWAALLNAAINAINTGKPDLAGDIGGTYSAPAVAKIAGCTLSGTPGTPSSSNFLRGDGTWASPGGGPPSGSASGDLSGSYPGPTVAKINGVAVTGTPSVGWVPTATSGSAATWQAPAGGAPSGSAGGDLSGTYPNPGVAKVAGVSLPATGAAAGMVPVASSSTAAAWGVPGYVGVNAQTGTTYTIVLSDQGKLVTLNNASAITVTLPQDSAVAIPVGGQIDFAGIGAGLVTFVAGTGATVNGTPSLVTRAQYSAVTAIKYAANTWLIVGDCA